MQKCVLTTADIKSFPHHGKEITNLYPCFSSLTPLPPWGCRAAELKDREHPNPLDADAWGQFAETPKNGTAINNSTRRDALASLIKVIYAFLHSF